MPVSHADNQVANIVLLTNCVLTSEPFQEHAAAIAADSAVQDAIVGTLISRCLPHLVTAYDEAALRSLLSQAAADDAASLQGQAAVVSTYCSVHKVVAVNLSQSAWPARQLSAWVAAAEAILRLQPQLLQLDGVLQQLPGSGMEQQAAGVLATHLLTLLRKHWPPPERAVMSGSRAGAKAADLRRQLAQAHLAGCRLAHWLAQRAAGGQPAGPAHSRLSRAWWCWLLLICINKVFQPALMLSTSAPEAQRPDG